MARVDTPRTRGTLIDRTDEIVRQFDQADKGYAFGDSGDAEMFAAEMADILEEWLTLTGQMQQAVNSLPKYLIPRRLRKPRA